MIRLPSVSFVHACDTCHVVSCVLTSLCSMTDTIEPAEAKDDLEPEVLTKPQLVLRGLNSKQEQPVLLASKGKNECVLCQDKFERFFDDDEGLSPQL